MSSEVIPEGRLGKAASNGDEHGQVVLVPVVVDHHEDLSKAREKGEWATTYQVRILEGNVGRKEGLGHGAACIHGIKAQVSGEVGEEVNPPLAMVGREEEPG